MAANTHGNVIEHRLRQSLLQTTVEIFFAEVGTQEANAAVYVEADASGRHNRLGVGHVRGGVRRWGIDS